jgi:hypothetical protein
VLAARLLAHLISFASTRDPLVLSGVVLTMMLLGLVATWIPVRRSGETCCTLPLMSCHSERSEEPAGRGHPQNQA